MLNRVVDERWLDDSSTVRRQFNFTYDSVGNMTSAVDPDSALNFTFDLLNRVETADVTGTPGLPDVVLTYAYDAVGNVLNMVDSSGVQVTSLYDERDLLINRVWQGGGVDPVSVDLGYNARRERTSVARYADAAGMAEIGNTAYEYDTAQRLTSIQHHDDLDQVFVDYDYSYDDAGRLVNESHHGDAVAYRYDALGQLTGADYSDNAPVADQTMMYDANGNRIDSGFAVGDNNRIRSDGTFDYVYDNEGNLIRRTNFVTSERTEYVWDYRNRLTRVEEFDEINIPLRQTLQPELTGCGRQTYTVAECREFRRGSICFVIVHVVESTVGTDAVVISDRETRIDAIVVGIIHHGLRNVIVRAVATALKRRTDTLRHQP